ncbi:unnamed protein product, partial [Laminaria digitata]
LDGTVFADGPRFTWSVWYFGWGVESWIADSGTSQHITYIPDCMYNLHPPSPENAQVYIGDGAVLAVEYVGTLDLIFDRAKNVRVTLESVAFFPGLKVNLLSLHTIQAREPVALDCQGTHLMGGHLIFPRDRAGPRLNATRSFP